MNRSWRIAKLSGIDLSLHWTFLALLGWVVAQGVLTGGWVRGFQELILAVSLFACVVLHELGHAFAARFCGISTLGITLLPIGGVASLERIPRQPRQELFIALAGPAVNVILLLGLLPIWWLSHTLASQPSFLLTVVNQLVFVNVMLILFNLLPAFPMDGGRVLRAALATRGNYVSATRTATRVGQGVALLFLVAGFVSNPLLIVIALFVAMAGEAEYQHVLVDRISYWPSPADRYWVSDPAREHRSRLDTTEPERPQVHSSYAVPTNGCPSFVWIRFPQGWHRVRMEL